ncbi:MAG: CPBP family intramembrane glutamic endopeptidase [Bryobacteraceae bacterium]|jgi:hypothetical protein
MNAAQGDRESGRAGWGPFAALMAALAVIFGAAARMYLQRYPLPLAAVAGIYVCFMLSLALALAPGLRGSRAALERWFTSRRRTPALVLIWVAPYLIYAAGTGDFRWSALATLLAVGAALVVLYAWFPVREEAQFGWQDAAVAGVLIAVVLSRQLRGIWNVPQNLDFVGRLYLIGVAAWCWTLVRVVPGLGYDLWPCRESLLAPLPGDRSSETQPLPDGRGCETARPLPDGRGSETAHPLPDGRGSETQVAAQLLKAAGVNFVWFALLALPAGLALRFIAWNPRWRGWPQLGLDYLQIFLFIALLEELFFRGFLQTLLAKTLRSEYGAQALVACLFGLFHILHAPFPNWRYVALATVAGWFYGSAFRQGGGVMAAALTHAAVDTVWRTFFTRG